MEKHLKTWGEIMPQPNAWISEKKKKCKTPIRKNTDNYLHFEMQEEKIVELSTRILMKTWKNELNP